MMTRLWGSLSQSSSSSLVTTPGKSAPGIGGTAGVEPVALLPRVCWDRELPQLLRELETLKGLGVREAMAGTLDGVRRAVELGFLTRGRLWTGRVQQPDPEELKKAGPEVSHRLL